jgi:hypothetical protein
VFLLADFSFPIATYTSFDLPSIKDGREYRRNGILLISRLDKEFPLLIVRESGIFLIVGRYLIRL